MVPIVRCLLDLGNDEPCIQGENCRLPKCFCLGQKMPPKNLTVEEIPQIVVLAFNDAVNVQNYGYYLKLFEKTRKNSNGCPIKMTLFVQDLYTNYTMVKDLYRRGMEMASHSITHKLPISYWKEASEKEISYEINEQKSRLVQEAGIPEREIRGWRSPYLQPTGDLQFSVLNQNGFHYDASLGIQRRNLKEELFWPGTLHYKWPFKCEINPCPAKNYSLWEVPVISLVDQDSLYPCMYVDSCINKPEVEEEAFQLLWKNFNSFYTRNKTPFILNIHARWLNTDFQMVAMERFILSLLGMDDVYIVTMHQMLEWIRNPVNLTDILDFKPWKCPENGSTTMVFSLTFVASVLLIGNLFL
ncbi:hypothetical protein SNE40_003699 [Patella caerulea]|uniref:NodB homology domain-containing protein n=1 Tax=Patella caerulea TaxID=87958 RepID=A0AAN8Q0J5_PATCE